MNVLFQQAIMPHQIFQSVRVCAGLRMNGQIIVAMMLVTVCIPSEAMAATVTNMTTNGRTNPLGISAEDISFGWSTTSDAFNVTQTCYRLRVGTDAGLGDTWDSGRVASDRQVDIALPANRHLAAATRYYWQVKVWNGDGNESDWCPAAWFETGLFSEDDWRGAKWVGRASVLKPEDWADYKVTVEFALDAEAFGMLFRATPDAREGYMVQVNVAGAQPILKQHKKLDGKYMESGTVDLSTLGFTNRSLRRDPHVLIVQTTGPRITTYLDGRQIDDRRDDTFKQGLIGFRTHGAERATVYRVTVNRGSDDQTVMASDFAKGGSGFTDGLVADGVFRVSGSTEAMFTAQPQSLPLVRGNFQVRAGLKSARVYASAVGIYDLSVNGKKADDQYLAPGWTDYQQRIQHQTYDITAMLTPGPNTLGAAIADGWYRGKVGLSWRRVYGDTLGLIALIKLTYQDGSVEWIGTGPDWKAGDGPLLRADLQDGESYDAGREQRGWNTPGFDASGWPAVAVLPKPADRLVPQPDDPIRILDTIEAKKRTTLGGSRSVYDFGQNLVGVARLTMKGRKGQTVIIRYGEETYRVGERKGQLYTDNLREAQATDRYIFANTGTVTYQPTFTQHGFRYIELSGLDEPPPLSNVKALVLGSNLPDTGSLRLSNPLLDQLVRNIRWGQRGNFLSIPTDTPARNERLGWTGDISVFVPTAGRYQDTRAFLSKWMDDIRDAQKRDGNLPAVVPQPRGEFDATGVGWSDAIITVPYAVWRSTGDARIVRRNWEAMQQFYAFVHSSATRDGNLLEEGRSCWFSGDWLSLEDVNRLDEHKVIATAYFAEDTRMMAEMAELLGERDKAAGWLALLPQIRRAFVDAYRRPDGSIYTGSQTAYALALGMNLITDPQQRERTAALFVEKLEADKYHLRTGFLGTPWLLPALSAIGRDDLAMRLLLNDDYPSWGYEIRMGATTVWERWNSIRPNGEFGPVDMNSFNHYAYGAVGDWMFEHLGGVQILDPGYKKSRIAPLFNASGVNWGRCDLHTPYGLLATDWKVEGRELGLAVTVPENTSAEVVIPAATAAAVRIGDAPAEKARGVRTATWADGRVTLFVGSGTYRFTAPAPR